MIVCATTMHAYVTDQDDTCLAWLYNAEEMVAQCPPDAGPVILFAALEVDARGLDPFRRVLGRMEETPGALADWWTFSFDDGAETLTTENRLRRITMGQNIANEFAMAKGADWLLFCAADCAPPGDVFPKLLEMNHQLVAPETPTYGLWNSPTCAGVPRMGRFGLDRTPGRAKITYDLESPLVYPNFPVLDHMASAACVMLGRDVFRQLRWRVDQDKGMTDDPCLHHDALTVLGIPTYVRQDCLARHYPETIGGIETRGHDMTVVR